MLGLFFRRVMDFFNQSFWQGVAASFAVAVLVALFTPIKSRISDYLIKRRLKKHNQKLSMLTWEKDHLSKVKKSSVALNRAVYSDVFWLLLCLSLGLGIPILGPVVSSMIPIFIPVVKILTLLSLPIWFMALVIAFQNIKKFNSLHNYAKAIDSLNTKIADVENKIEAISPNK